MNRRFKGHFHWSKMYVKKMQHIDERIMDYYDL